MQEAVKCPADITTLQYDTACLRVQNDLEYPVDLFTVSSECYQCDPVPWTSVPLQATVSLVVSTVHSVTISATRQYEDITLCEKTLSFNEHEVASLGLNGCVFTVEKEGHDANLPLYSMGLGVAFFFITVEILRSCYHSQWVRNLFIRDVAIIDLQNDLGNPNSSTDSLLIQSELVPLRRVGTQRIQALDTFRGITIALMIFINHGGGKYWFFEHRAWNGITIADMVFPCFAWVMGVSLALSYRSKLRSCESRCTVFSMCLRRSLILVIVGIFMNMFNNNDLLTARYCGVLQRLGITHFIVSVLEITFMKKQPSFQRSQCRQISDLLDCWRQWLVILLLVAVQVSVSLIVDVPGCPPGYLGPGGAANHSAAYNCTGGIARYLDSLVFGDKHLYQRGPVNHVYHPPLPFDPEGILGTLTTCLNVYLGVQAGYIILNYSSTRERVVRWFFWAALTGVSAGFLCDWSQEGGLIPVNKQLWSLSFVLLTSSSAFFLFAVLFLVIDHFEWWSGGHLRYAGMNAIMLYIGHIVTKDSFPFSWQPVNMSTHGELLLMNVFGVALWLFIAEVLFRNEVFLSI